MRKSLIAIGLFLSLNSMAAYAVTPEIKAIPESCRALLTKLKFLTENTDRALNLLEHKRQLEVDNAQQVRKQGRLSRSTYVQSIVDYERLMYLLARGKSLEEIMGIVRPSSYAIHKSYRTLDQLLTRYAEFAQMETLTKEQAKEFHRVELDLIKESFAYGEMYGFYVDAMRLLTAVADGSLGKGDSFKTATEATNPSVRSVIINALPDTPADVNLNVAPRPSPQIQPVNPLPSPSVSPAPLNAEVIYKLSSPEAKKLAQNILRLLSSESEQTWLNADEPLQVQATLEQIEYMFRHNIYALIGKLRRDNVEEKKERKIWRMTLNAMTDFYLNMTDSDYIPQFLKRYRAIALKFAGINYNRIMRRRYLDRVQAIVEITRTRDENGNVIVRSDIDAINMQILSVREMSSEATGNDFLVTFARIAYHSNVWANIVKTLRERTVGHTSGPDFALLERMLEAEKRAKELRLLSYIYESDQASYIAFLTVQLMYTVGAEEGFRHWIWPYISPLFGF